MKEEKKEEKEEEKAASEVSLWKGINHDLETIAKNRTKH